VLADFYHMDEENEPLSDLFEARELLTHVHVADTERKRPGSGSYDYDTFFSELKRADYGRRISVECKWDDFNSECRESLQFMKSKWIETS
jgi:sugar phosphate isomerase/epimerase